MQRNKTRSVTIGSAVIGGRHPVLIQSMTNTKTHDEKATRRQIKKLVSAGCELVRVAVPDKKALSVLPALIAKAPVPLIADVHFDKALALGAIEAGIAKVRINPGNMGLDASREVAKRAALRGAAVRIGVNAGSLPEQAKKQCKTPQSLGRLMARTALRYARVLEQQGLTAIVLSVKASSIPATITAYRHLADQSDFPLHLGLTEAGGFLAGSIKTAAGLAPLLLDGIGDTLRVSLTGDPVNEIQVANLLLNFTGVRRRGVELIACPTCGRTEVDLTAMVERLEKALAHVVHPLTVAVMGCVVNGPGEARHADVGLAGAADGTFMLFAKGRVLKRVPAAIAVPALLAEIEQLLHRDEKEVQP